MKQVNEIYSFSPPGTTVLSEYIQNASLWRRILSRSPPLIVGITLSMAINLKDGLPYWQAHTCLDIAVSEVFAHPSAKLSWCLTDIFQAALAYSPVDDIGWGTIKEMLNIINASRLIAGKGWPSKSKWASYTSLTLVVTVGMLGKPITVVS